MLKSAQCTVMSVAVHPNNVADETASRLDNWSSRGEGWRIGRYVSERTMSIKRHAKCSHGKRTEIQISNLEYDATGAKKNASVTLAGFPFLSVANSCSTWQVTRYGDHAWQTDPRQAVTSGRDSVAALSTNATSLLPGSESGFSGSAAISPPCHS